MGKTIEERQETPSPSIDGIFILGRGFIQFDNFPLSFVQDTTRAKVENADKKWSVIDIKHGSLLMLFSILTQAVSVASFTTLDATPYLSTFNIQSQNLNFMWSGTALNTVGDTFSSPFEIFLEWKNPCQIVPKNFLTRLGRGSGVTLIVLLGTECIVCPVVQYVSSRDSQHDSDGCSEQVEGGVHCTLPFFIGLGTMHQTPHNNHS